MSKTFAKTITDPSEYRENDNFEGVIEDEGVTLRVSGPLKKSKFTTSLYVHQHLPFVGDPYWTDVNVTRQVPATIYPVGTIARATVYEFITAQKVNDSEWQATYKGERGAFISESRMQEYLTQNDPYYEVIYTPNYTINPEGF